MNKTDLLFQMMEHPQAYTDQQWQEILSDEECRDLYTLMAKTQRTFDTPEEIDDETIDAEWNRLTASSDHRWLRVAAMFIGILMISGIAIAAIHYLSPSPSPKGKESHSILMSDTVKMPATTLSTGKETEAEAPVVFDNVALDKMLSTIAAHFDKEVEFLNGEARQLRFYFVWRKDEPLDTTLHRLNLFESVNIELKSDKIVVE